MNELKYVCVIPPGFNEIGARAIIFNGLINHIDMVRFLIEKRGFTVMSAGFIDISNGIKCYGESESISSYLNKKVNSDNPLSNIIVSQTLTKQHPLFGFTKH